jgi:hypothetical protein
MSDGKKPMSLRARIARLDVLIPEDGTRLCCLEGFDAYRETVSPWLESLGPHLDPPLDPPELPLDGLCRKTGEPLCSFALERAAQIWERRRRLAVNMRGLSEEDL